MGIRMEIQYETGNLLDSPYPILHGCNASGYAFKSGVAGHIRNKYPFAFTSYVEAHKKTPLQLGDVIIAHQDNILILSTV